jgi:hypothetical protein
MVVRMIVGLVLTAVAVAIFGRRLWWLKRPTRRRSGGSWSCF